MISEGTMRQVSHFGWLYPNGIDVRDPEVYGDSSCPCGCGTTAEDAREMRREPTPGSGESVDIVRAVQTCFACPSQWDAFGDDGAQYYFRYRHSFGSVDLARRADGEWVDRNRPTIAEFETDEQDGGVMNLEEFCERAGLTLDLRG